MEPVVLIDADPMAVSALFLLVAGIFFAMSTGLGRATERRSAPESTAGPPSRGSVWGLGLLGVLIILAMLAVLAEAGGGM